MSDAPVIASREQAHPTAGAPAAGRWERPSRWLIWLAAATLLLALGWNGWEAWRQYDRLRALRCDEPVFDFGRAFSGRVVEHTFHVVNLSRLPVTIERVATSCGCTTTAKDLEGTTIDSGEAFEIPVRLNLAGKSGEIEQPVVVKFVGAPRLQLTVKLKGTAEKEWSWEPARVVFDGLRADSAATRTVTLTQHPDAPPAELGHISAPSPLLAEVVPGGDAGAGGRRQWTLRLTTVPPLPAGRSDRSVYAYTQGLAVMIGPIPVALIVEDPRGE